MSYLTGPLWIDIFAPGYVVATTTTITAMASWIVPTSKWLMTKN